MFHIIQADFFRLFRSKFFWLVEGLLTVFLVSASLWGFSYSSRFSPQGRALLNSLQALTGTKAAQSFPAAMALASFLTVILIVQLLSWDLTQKLYQNVLTYGLSRTVYYLSKLAVCLLLILCQVLFTFACLLVLGSLAKGTGSPTAAFSPTLLLLLGRAFLFVLTWPCLSLGLLYMSRSVLWTYLGCFAVLFSLAGLASLFPATLSDHLLYLVSAGSLLAGYLNFVKKDL